MDTFVKVVYVTCLLLASDIALAKTENGILKADCPFLTVTGDILSFTSHMDEEEFGFSVDLIFSDSVNILQANDSKKAPPQIYEVSKKHWIIYVQVVKGKVKKAAFDARYVTNGNAGDVNIVGVIYNGEKLCGEGTSAAFTLNKSKYDGRRECKPSSKIHYEHESSFSLKEHFFSDQVGLVVDIFFSSDVDIVEGVSNIMVEKHDERRYTFFNSGYITSEERPVEITFKANHFNRAPPKIAAIVINNEVICGFATFIDVFQSDESEENHLHSLDALSLSLNIITACGLLIAIVTGIFAWKLTTSQILTSHPTPSLYNEPIYSLPTKSG